MITPIFAPILALMLVALSINVIKERRSSKIAIGNGDNNKLIRKIRAQGNLAEYAPIFVILLGFAEYMLLPKWAVIFFV